MHAKDDINCAENTGIIMFIRKAESAEISQIFELFQSAIRRLRNEGIDQWDVIYPDLSLLKKDIEQGNMYLCEVNNCIAALFVLSKEQDSEYLDGHWNCIDESFVVVHRLCVNPLFQGKGIATQVMLEIESVLKTQSISSIRLDAYSKNPAALKLYDKIGYTKVGTVQFRKGEFFLYEKII